MNKVKDIINLAAAGLKIRTIARATGTSRTAVKNIITRCLEAGVDGQKARTLDDLALRGIIYPVHQRSEQERLRNLQEIIPKILGELGKKHATLQVQWEIYRETHPDGYAYSRFCDYVREHTRKNKEQYLGMEYKYGQMLLIDFAGVGHYYIDRLTGEQVAVNLFVAVLPASQFTAALFTLTQQTIDYIGGSEHAIRAIGGVPDSIVPDCATSVVSKADYYVSEIQAQYCQFADFYGALVTPARPGHPRDKALVESSINNIYRWVYPRLARQEYYSLAELNEALQALMEQYNRRKMRLFQSSREELFLQHEKQTLKPLPERAFEFKKYQAPHPVAFNCHLWFSEDKHYYSVPERFQGKRCCMFYTSTNVEIFHENTRIATHLRDRSGKKKYTTNPEHITSKHAEFLKWTPERFRSWAKDIGENVEYFVQSMLDRSGHFTHAYKCCMPLLKLGRVYGNERLDLACKYVQSQGCIDYKKVTAVLAKGLDRCAPPQPSLLDLLSELPREHANLRHTNTNNKEEHIA
jgi:transposase